MKNIEIKKLFTHYSLLITSRRKAALGFSLMELLVVISIIALLVTMGVVSYSTAQKKGRDARRQGDMKAIQAAFEQYYAVSNGSYPAACPDSGGTITISGQTFTIPTDPKNSGSYTYTKGTCDTTQYCYCAFMESGTGNSGAVCAAGATTYYCVSQRQ
jgi:prepilin-type N-terminal cleavage/methylation domain-containing protein